MVYKSFLNKIWQYWMQETFKRTGVERKLLLPYSTFTPLKKFMFLWTEPVILVNNFTSKALSLIIIETLVFRLKGKEEDI